MRSEINKKLLEINDTVFYGIVPDNVEIDEWNYLVFGQGKIGKKSNVSNDLQGYWYVTIVHEDFIPDELLFSVLDKMSEIPGLRLADGEFEYGYTFKGNTNLVVEMLRIDFTKTKKRC